MFPKIYLGTFSRNFFFKNSHPLLMMSSFLYTGVVNFSRKKVSMFCMLLCCSCLWIGVMSYRLLHVTKLIPNYYSQWHHNDALTGKILFSSIKVCRKFTETLCNFLRIFLFICMLLTNFISQFIIHYNNLI